MIPVLALAFVQPETLHVDAAASLRETFTALAQNFERAHPGVKVELEFAGSQQLAAQIAQGQECDVFASADERTIQKVQLDPSGSRRFARNILVIVAPSPKRLNLRGLAFVKSLIVAAPQVPVGGYTDQMLSRASTAYGLAWYTTLKSKIVSQEQDVRAVLAKIELKEADAGIVYSTDAKEAGKKTFAFPLEARFQPNIDYPIGIPASSNHTPLAKAFITYTLSRQAQKILQTAGFLPPRKS